MGYSTLFYFTILFFITFSCDSSNEKTRQHTSSDSEDPKTVYRDTADTSFIKNIHTDTTDTTDTAKHTTSMKDTMPDLPPPPDPAPAPGTLRLEAQMIGMQKAGNDQSAAITFKVLSILAIGSSTPAVVQNDTMTVPIKALPDSLKEGNRFITVLLSRPGLQVGNEKKSESNWQVMSIKKEKIKNDQ